MLLWVVMLGVSGEAPELWLRQCREPSTALRLAWRAPGFRVVRPEIPPGPLELLAAAQGFLGAPYVWGSTGPEAFDCSGFVNRVYALNGYDLPRTSREMAKVGLVVPRHAAEPGDLLFFVKTPGDERISHVAMYVGDDELIHAAQGKGEVTLDRLTSRYYGTRLVGVRRILALPMGVYSDRRGLAREGVLVDDPERLGKVVAHVEKPPPDRGNVQQEQIIEHTEPRPLGFAGTFVKGAVTQVGPRTMLYEATDVGMRLGATSSSDVWSLLAVPEVSYFDHDNALHVGVAVPVEIPVGGNQSFGELAAKQWSGAGFTRVLREASFGQKEAPLYLDLSRTASGSLGHGQLMRYYTPNIASGLLPHYILERNALSLSADGFLDWGGAELFVDDVVAPRVLGTLGFVRPSCSRMPADRSCAPCPWPSPMSRTWPRPMARPIA